MERSAFIVFKRNLAENALVEALVMPF